MLMEKFVPLAVNVPQLIVLMGIAVTLPVLIPVKHVISQALKALVPMFLLANKEMIVLTLAMLVMAQVPAQLRPAITQQPLL